MNLIDVAAAAGSRMVDDDALSIAMQNVRLSAANGAVMLRGPVEIMAENIRNVENYYGLE